MIVRIGCASCEEPLEDYEFEYCDPCLMEMGVGEG